MPSVGVVLMDDWSTSAIDRGQKIDTANVKRLVPIEI